MTFVVVEGPEGAGKSTLVRWLGTTLRAEGRAALTVSTIAYQVAGRGLPRPDVEAALRVATGGLVPDLTLILDIPVTVGRERQRSAGKAQDRIEREDDTFHTRVRDAYRSASGPGIVHIDASQPKKAVQDAAWREVAAATGALSLRST